EDGGEAEGPQEGAPDEPVAAGSSNPSAGPGPGSTGESGPAGQAASDDGGSSLVGMEPIEIQDEMERSFLDYAMSVVVARALPDVRDGLKPVQRRILFTMKEAGYTSDKVFRKSAR